MRLAALIAVVVLTGCTHQRYENEFAVPVTAGRYPVETTVNWMPRDQVQSICEVPGDDWMYEGCYSPAFNTIYAPVPQHANDTDAMCILGHELMHAMVGDWHRDENIVSLPCRDD